jgi:hypothetical protein
MTISPASSRVSALARLAGPASLSLPRMAADSSELQLNPRVRRHEGFVRPRASQIPHKHNGPWYFKRRKYYGSQENEQLSHVVTSR